MAAMKPRTGDGPMEVTKEARSMVMRIPLEGGGRLVVELNVEEATNLGNVLNINSSLVSKIHLETFAMQLVTNIMGCIDRINLFYVLPKHGYICINFII